MTRQAGSLNGDHPEQGLLRQLRKNMGFLVFIVFAAAFMVAVFVYFRGDGPQIPVSDESLPLTGVDEEMLLLASIHKSLAIPPTPTPPPTPIPRNIAIIAGHRGSDSGTECQDGLTEAQINNAIAERVATALGQSGIPAATLDEFDPGLGTLHAAGLVSIHADSCDDINDLATGFKIAGSSFVDSSSLSICVEQAYRQATGLAYHPNSITPHMADYHAFRKIPPGIPAIIIEVGFLNRDRQMLTVESERVVQGLTQGIRCYMETVP